MFRDINRFIENGLQFVASSNDLKTTLANLVKSAVQTAGSDSGSLYVLNPSGYLEPFVTVNFDPEYLKGCQTVALGQQCCGRAALHKMPWIVEDMWTDPLFIDCRDAAKASGFRSGFSIPVLTACGECLGSLGFQFRESHRPSQSTLELSRLFAQVIAVAMIRHRELSPAQHEEEPAAAAVSTPRVDAAVAKQNS